MIEAQPRCDTKKGYFSKPENWVSLGTLLFVGAYTVLTYCALKNSEDAVAVAQKANEIAIRPYIKVILKPETLLIHTSQDRDNKDDLKGIRFTIENTGKLPAKTYIESAVTWQGPGHDADENRWNSINRVGEIFLFPGAPSQELTSQTLSMTKGQLTDLVDKGGHGRFYVMVDVFYGPGSGTKRPFETKVCNSYLMSGSPELRLSDEQPCSSENSNDAR